MGLTRPAGEKCQKVEVFQSLKSTVHCTLKSPFQCGCGPQWWWVVLLKWQVKRLCDHQESPLECSAAVLSCSRRRTAWTCRKILSDFVHLMSYFPWAATTNGIHSQRVVATKCSAIPDRTRTEYGWEKLITAITLKNIKSLCRCLY